MMVVTRLPRTRFLSDSKKPSPALTIGKQNQRQPASRQRQEHRRGGVVADAELPNNRLAVIGLHEPAVRVRQRLAIRAGRRRPRKRKRWRPDDVAPLQGAIE